MPTDSPYTIADLARLTGVNVRTIRYYLAQGLLPASGESGPGAHYGEGHLDRLRLTRRLQEQHLPLAEIRRQLAAMTDDQIAGVIAAPVEPRESPTGSALDYVRAVLGQQILGQEASASAGPPISPISQGRQSPPAAPAPASTRAPAPAPAPAAAPAPVSAPSQALLLRTPRYARMGMVSEPAEMTTAQLAEAPTPAPERSQWERLSLGPNIELNIRRPLSRIEQRRVERLITIARQVLKEDAK